MMTTQGVARTGQGWLVLAGATAWALMVGSGVAANPTGAPAILSSQVGLRVEAARTLVSIPDHRTTEFAVASDPANPRHLVAGAIDWDTSRGTWTCGVFVSRDGGRSWKGKAVIPSSDGHFQGDPWVAIDGKGAAHYTCLDGKVREYGGPGQPYDGGARILYARSDDGGSAWGKPVSIAPRRPSHHVDRTGIVADPKAGFVYACTNESDFLNPASPAIFDGLGVARSKDGGRSWSPTEQVFTPYGACRGGAMGARGEVYISFWGMHAGGYAVGVIRSYDHGVTWSKAAWTPIESYCGGSLAVSGRSGDVFVASDSDGGRTPILMRSADRGETFERVKIPAMPSECCTHVIRSMVAVNERGEVGLEIVLGDEEPSRGCMQAPLGSTGLSREVWVAVSRDGGDTWLDPVRVTATDVTRSYLGPRTFIPSAQGAAGYLSGAASNPPMNAGSALTVFFAIFGPPSRTDHLTAGGDYWGGMATSETPSFQCGSIITTASRRCGQLGSRLRKAKGNLEKAGVRGRSGGG